MMVVKPEQPPETLPASAPSGATAADAVAETAAEATAEAAPLIAKFYAQQAHAPATSRAYAVDWIDFTAWCRTAELAAFPATPAAVAGYLASLALTHGRSTLERRLAAIGYQHRLRGAEWTPHPAIRATLRGIFRIRPSRGRQAAALTSVELRKLLAGCGGDLAGTRDRALLLLGFAGALRRAELVGIDCEHLTLTPTGLRLLIPRSKTDAEGEGAEIGIPRGKRPDTCPVRAVETWLERSACQYGPVFRKVDQWGNIEHSRLGPDAVRQILRRRAAEAGLSVPASERLSPHGLRAGFVTEAYQAGASDEQIMQHTRHRDLKTMRGYVRRSRLLTDSPVKLLDI